MGTKRNPNVGLDDLSSEFDYGSEVEKKKQKTTDFLQKEYPGEPEKLSRKDAKKWFQDEHGRMHRQMGKMMKLTAYQRHKEMMNLYHYCYEGSTAKLDERDPNERTDYDVLKANHKFLWEEEDVVNAPNSYATRLAKKYYDKLFKEYCICDLSRYKKNQVAMRWRTEAEVKSGKGQFVCGARKCEVRHGLTSWEVNFSYEEQGDKKNALVKVRLCETCSAYLNYGSQKKKAVKKPSKWSKEEKKEKKKSRKDRDSSEDKEGEKDVKPDVASSSSEKKTNADGAIKSGSTKIWQGPVQQEIVRTVDDEIDDFLNDLFD